MTFANITLNRLSCRSKAFPFLASLQQLPHTTAAPPSSPVLVAVVDEPPQLGERALRHLVGVDAARRRRVLIRCGCFDRGGVHVFDLNAPACLLLLLHARARFARRRAIIKTRARTKHNHPPHHTCTASAKMGRRIPSSSENSIVTMASAPPAAAASILFRFVQLVLQTKNECISTKLSCISLMYRCIKDKNELTSGAGRERKSLCVCLKNWAAAQKNSSAWRSTSTSKHGTRPLDCFCILYLLELSVLWPTYTRGRDHHRR